MTTPSTRPMARRDFLGLLGAGAGAFAFAALPLPLSPLPLRSLQPLADDRRFVERWSWAMGQPVHLQLFTDDEARGYAAAQAVFAELRRVEARLSLFDDASDLRELNRRAGRGPMRVDADVAAVLAAGLAARRATGGAFDLAVEPLMRAWGFHRPRTTAPSAAEVAEARAAVEHAVVRLESDAGRGGARVELPSAHTQLDPGGIGVGYGLDRAAAVLRAHGIRRALLDVSGDCLALGAPPGEPGWAVDLADSAHSGRVVRTVRLRDAALATSANTVAVVRYGRAVRGHVMDPETGYPAGAIRQATVVARTGILADALSTAMLVTGRRAPGVLSAYTL
ncbi:MAG TPA: FAD:protein FMN transferase [Gemmatimonadales bacterium]|nr:FAD:protein FMN transferase [Gemmatimonadales bacterium]